jgi:hypothetical protein
MERQTAYELSGRHRLSLEPNRPMFQRAARHDGLARKDGRHRLAGHWPARSRRLYRGFPIA